MIAENFKIQFERLQKVYGIGEDQVQEFWTVLKQYGDQDVEEAVDDYIRESAYTPKPSDILKQVTQVERNRKRRELEENWRNVDTVRCPRCRDTGLIIWETPTGVELSRACDCEAGHRKYPWSFLSDEAKEAWFREQEKKGRTPPRNPLRADDEFFNNYCYVVKKPEPAEAVEEVETVINAPGETSNQLQGDEPVQVQEPDVSNNPDREDPVCTQDK